MFIKLRNFLFVLSFIVIISGVVGISGASQQEGPIIKATHTKERPSGATYHDVLLYDGKESNAYKLVVIGDSVAWGNGLNQEYKYYNQVAEDLKETLKRPVEIIVYAHSGAKISAFGLSAEEWNYKINGVVPNGNLNKEGPTLMEQAAKIPSDADLILVSGGINDVGINKILNPNNPASEISDSSKKLLAPMTKLLTNILSNTKTDAKIVVTGYYPIISDDTTIEQQDKFITDSFQFIDNILATDSQKKKIVENNRNLKKRVADNSNAFYTETKTSLTGAVAAANKADNKNRVVFVQPTFESTNSYGARDTFLWELNADQTSNDDQSDERKNVIANANIPIFKKKENEVNAIGHPNIKGASQYKDAIMATILDDSKGLGVDWLTGEAPDPISRVYASIVGEPADEPTYASQIPVGDTQTKKFSTANLPPEKVALSIDIRDKNGNTVPVGTKVTVRDGSGKYIQVDWSSIGNTLAFGAPGYWIITVDAPGYKTNTQYVEVSSASSSTSFRMNLLEKGINIQPPASQSLSSSKLALAGMGTPLLPSPTSGTLSSGSNKGPYVPPTTTKTTVGYSYNVVGDWTFYVTPRYSSGRPVTYTFASDGYVNDYVNAPWYTGYVPQGEWTLNGNQVDWFVPERYVGPWGEIIFGSDIIGHHYGTIDENGILRMGNWFVPAGYQAYAEKIGGNVRTRHAVTTRVPSNIAGVGPLGGGGDSDW